MASEIERPCCGPSVGPKCLVDKGNAAWGRASRWRIPAVLIAREHGAGFVSPGNRNNGRADRGHQVPQDSIGIRMSARVEEPSHRHRIVEHKDRHARLKLMRSLIVSPWGSGCNLRRPGKRAPAACRGGLRSEFGGLCGYSNSLAVVPPTQFDRVAHPRGSASRSPAENDPTVYKTAAPLDNVDRRDKPRDRPGHDGGGRQSVGVFGRDASQCGA